RVQIQVANTAVVLGPAEIRSAPTLRDIRDLYAVDLPGALEVVGVDVPAAIGDRDVPSRSRATPVDRGALRGRPAGLLFLAPVPTLDSARDARRGETPDRHHKVQAEPPPVLRRLRDLRLCTGNGSQSGLRRPARFATRPSHQTLPGLRAGVAVSIAPGP